MGETISYSPFDSPNLNFVDVIATFNKKGEMQPLYIRIDGEQFQIISCYLKDENFAHRKFVCKINDHGIAKTIELVYMIRVCGWALSLD